VLVPAASLGLAPTVELDAFSYGRDQVANGPVPIRLHYSVTRTSQGIVGSVIETEALGNGAAGDRFRVTIWGGAALGAVVLDSDAPAHGLTPLPGQSELDGHSLPAGLVTGPIY
jgi:hypothetical protein